MKKWINGNELIEIYNIDAINLVQFILDEKQKAYFYSKDGFKPYDVKIFRENLPFKLKIKSTRVDKQAGEIEIKTQECPVFSKDFFSTIYFDTENLCGELVKNVVAENKYFPVLADVTKIADDIKKNTDEVCDPVIIEYIREAVTCLHAGARLAATVMIGAASEKGIHILIDSYINSITDITNRENIKKRIKGNISSKFEEFKESYKGCHSRPSDLNLKDSIKMIEQMFHFYRITRNSAGHPITVPDIKEWVIASNLGQFSTYIEHIYYLVAHFKSNGVIL